MFPHIIFIINSNIYYILVAFFLPSELFETIRIPKERIGALIGTEGKTKRKLEKLTGTRIEVDSETGTIEVESKGNSANFLDAVNAIKAIGRGFTPEKALELLGEKTLLDIIKISDLVGGSEKTIKTKRARVIGTKGLAREAIEKATGAKISVQGKTVAIIGEPGEIELAREAVEMLLEGANHKKVMDYLKKEQQQREKFTI